MMKYAFTVIMATVLWACQDQQENRAFNGALEGINFQSAQRAFPFEEPPAEAFYKSYLEIKTRFRGNHLRENPNKWASLGPLNTAGRALSLAVNPSDPNQLYVGTASGGLWRSDNLGRDTSWYRIRTGYPVTSVSSVAISPDNGQIVMIGTGEVYNYSRSGTGAAYRSTRGAPGFGILRSGDGGETWDLVLDWTKDQNQGVNRISFSDSDPEKVVAATTSGVFLSENGGQNWRMVLDEVMSTDAAFHPQNSNWIVAACGNFDSPGKGLYLSKDGGNNWEQTLDGNDLDFMGKIRIDFFNSDGDVVYASIGDAFSPNNTEFTWLVRSEDGGETWQLRSDFDYARYQGWFAHDLAVDPNDGDRLFTVGIYPFVSVDGGRSMSRITSDQQVSQGRPPVGDPDGPPNYMHVDFHEVIFHPTDPSILLFANDGGVFISEDGGQTFESRNGGLQTTQFYNGVSVAAYDTNLVFGGLQDNNSVLFDGEPAWVRTLAGDGGASSIHPLDGSTIGSLQFMTTFISESIGGSWARVLDRGFGEPACFIAPIVRSESEPDVVYAASSKLYRSLDGGRNWDVVNNARDIGDGAPALSMAVSPNDPDFILCGLAPFSGESSVWMTLNGGRDWSRVGEGQLPNRYPTDIVFHPESEEIAYVVFGGFLSGHVFKTADLGNTWEDVTDNLPDLPVSAIAIDPDHPEMVYIGNDLSVFYSSQGGGNWEIFDQDLPEALWVIDLQIHQEHRLLYCASHGNGVYKTNLVEPTLTAHNDVPTPDDQLLITPNPVRDGRLRFQLEGELKITGIDITGLNGMKVNEVKSASGDNGVILPSSLVSGTYILRVSSEKGIHIAPFLYLSQTE